MRRLGLVISNNVFPQVILNKISKYLKQIKESQYHCPDYKTFRSAFSAYDCSCQKLTFFFSICVFFHSHSRITGLQGKGKGISLTPHYHFHPLHRHLDISRTITAESSPLYIASSRTRTGNP